MAAPNSKTETKLDAKSTRAMMYTQLKLGPDLHSKIKAASHLLKEELWEFVSIACEERLDRLRKEGRLTI